MAYDKDSNIGQQRANPGNPQVGQMVIHEQKLTSIPVLESKVTSIPVLESKTTSIPVLESKTTSMQLQNTARQIDLLSMEEFGHNVSKLRKGLSITDATQVNTDKEYGVMQIEDDFSFTESSVETLTDDIALIDNQYPGWIINYPNQVATGVEETSDKIKETLTKVPGSSPYAGVEPSYAIPYLRTVNRTASAATYYNVQEIHCHGGTTSHKFTNADPTTYTMVDVAKASTLTPVGTDSPALQLQRGTLTSNPTYPDNTGVGVGVKRMYGRIDNYSDKSIHFSYLGYIVDGNGFTNIDPTSHLSPAVASGGYANFDTGSDGTITTLQLFLGYNKGTGPTVNDVDFMPINITANNTAALSNVTMSFVFGVPVYTSLGATYQYKDGFNNPYNVPSNRVFPKCVITITLASNNGAENTIIFNLDPTQVYSTKYDILVGDIKNPTIRDLCYANYFLASKIVLATDIATYTNTVLSYQVCGSNTIESVLSVPNAMSTFVSTNITVNRSKFVKSYTLFDIIDSLKIVIIRREDNTVQLGVKHIVGSSLFYYSARNDLTISINDFTIDSLKIIEVSNNSIGFFAIVNGIRKLYKFHSYYDHNGGLLVEQYRGIYDFYCVNVDNDDFKTIPSFPKQIGDKDLVLNMFSLDSSIYKQTISSIPITASTTGNVMTLNKDLLLNDSICELIELGRYVVKDTCIPFAIGNNIDIPQSSSTGFISNLSSNKFGSTSTALIKIPSVTTGKEWTTLPLRLIDEYPEVFYRNSIADTFATLGKTNFVAYNGDLYKSSKLSLVCDTNSPMLIGNGKIYFDGEMVYIASSKLTEVYSFSDLGFIKILSIEDEVICNPVKISVGILACGKRGIWNITQEGVRLIWQSDTDITQASLKTDIDNSCIAVLDNGLAGYDILCTLGTAEDPDTEDQVLVTLGTAETPIVDYDSILCTARTFFTVVTINRFGFVSSQVVESTLANVNFIDIGATSDLIVIDTTGTNTINTLLKESPGTDDYYYLQSNQNVEYYEQTVYSELVKIKVFAMGTGTIDLYLNGSSTSEGTITLSSVTRYTEYSFSISSVAMNMLDYKFKVKTGIKMLQRIIGVIIPKEEYYG